jgi:hypothetical protein
VLNQRVLIRLFGHKRDEVTREWRKLYNVELNDLYCSQNTILVTKSRGVRWAGHLACMGREDVNTKYCYCNLGEAVPLGRPRIKCEDDFKMDF